MEKQKLKVEYTGGVANEAFERALTAFLYEHGFVWYGQGIDLNTGVRDMAFEKVRVVYGS